MEIWQQFEYYNQLVNATPLGLADPAARGICTALKHKTKALTYFPIWPTSCDL